MIVDELMCLGILAFCAPTMVFWSVVTLRLLAKKGEADRQLRQQLS